MTNERITDEACDKAYWAMDRCTSTDNLVRMRAAIAAALPLIQPAQGGAVDLSRFRKAVKHWRNHAHLGEIALNGMSHYLLSAEEYSARVKEADELLAIIDSQAALRAQPSAAPALPEVTDEDVGASLDAASDVLPCVNWGVKCMRAGLESYRARLLAPGVKP